jgi:Ca2+-binding RTX toxin-like protein
MAVSYKDVVLSPARAGDTVAFTGTDQDERVTFANPHQYLFDVDLSLDGGNDRVTEQAFDILNARVSAGSGDDMVSLDNVGALTVHAGTGDDTLSLGSGDGPVDARGGAGDDRIDAYASSGAAVHGGAGDDWIRSDGSGGDSPGDAWGGAGDDYVEVRGQTIFADGGAGDDVITGGTGYGADIHGGTGDDTILIGGGGLFDGGDGDDTIYVRDVGGEEGEDVFDGGRGNDTIRYTGFDESFTVTMDGGPGRDLLYAGPLRDELHFVPTDTPAGAGRDVVRGFTHGQDHLALDGDADVSRAGVQHYEFVGQTRDPGPGQVGYYASGGDTVVDGFDGRTRFEIRLSHLTGHLDASDFIA